MTGKEWKAVQQRCVVSLLQTLLQTSGAVTLHVAHPEWCGADARGTDNAHSLPSYRVENREAGGRESLRACCSSDVIFSSRYSFTTSVRLRPRLASLHSTCVFISWEKTFRDCAACIELLVMLQLMSIRSVKLSQLLSDITHPAEEGEHSWMGERERALALTSETPSAF